MFLKVYFKGNSVTDNTISGCETGIYSISSNDNLTSNNIINNYYGIWTYNSTDTIQFNSILNNTYSLRNDIGTDNATNNWWGSNNDPSTIPNDIDNITGTVNSNPWLILSVNASSTNSGGNTSVTADLNYNSDGVDTLSQGFIPDGTPASFTTNTGTIINQAYTIEGQASTILNLNTAQQENVTVSASVDNQNVSTSGLVSTGNATITITSTAIDNITGLPLNINDTIPLNNPITWLSVAWINIGMFSDELQIIVNGTVVETKYFSNAAYTTWENSYPLSVFDAILYVNQNLPYVYPDPTVLAQFWNNLTTTYNLTATELTFIQNYSPSFIDNLTINIVYPGVPGLNITANDPDNNNNEINLNFPGNVINRVSQVIYTGNGGYEGVHSFSIATSEVTTDLFNYWSNQYTLYQAPGAMSAAYSTFLTALMVEYYQDQMADNSKSYYNVTWSRTSPIIVSSCDDAYETYLTLECDHSLGMTVVGLPDEIMEFNFGTTSDISGIESEIMNEVYSNTYQSSSISGAFGSVVQDLFNDNLLSSSYVETFTQNGYIIIKSVSNDDEFMVIDPETGIVRDINTVYNICGVQYPQIIYCISNGYHVPVKKVGEVDTIGPFTIAWDGIGQVYIASSPSAYVSTDQIWADDELTITSNYGTDIFDHANQNGVIPASDLPITGILKSGVDTITAQITDVYGDLIGCSPLYIVQTNYIPPNQPPTPPPYPKNLPDPDYDDTIPEIIQDHYLSESPTSFWDMIMGKDVV